MKKIIIANWKANLLPKDSLSLAKKYANLKKGAYSVIVCPDFSVISSLSSLLSKSSVTLGAQDCSAFLPGSHTGEVCASSLKYFGVEFVIIGHSERRANGETDTDISKKINNTLDAKMTPVICVGESAEEFRLKKTKTVIKKQLISVLRGLTSKQLAKNIIIAYEPVWAVGTDIFLSPEETIKICKFIKEIATGIGSLKLAVLYGGSVSSANSFHYLNNEAVAGLLVGRASLDYKNFCEILKN